MKKIPSDIGIGADIEVFLYDNTLEEIVPSVGVLPGTKDKPYRPAGMQKGFAIQEDNVMVEYNVPPADTYIQFRNNIQDAVIMVLDELRTRHGSRYNLYTKTPTHLFQPKYLTSNQSRTIGCEPDFNAYEGGTVRVNPPTPGLYRSCGGHIHLGGDFNCPDFVAALFAEFFVGVKARLVVDTRDKRTEWYGKPGIYRPKPYGIEYRTPNNQWCSNGPKTEYVADAALKCAKYLTESSAIEIQAAFRKIPWVRVREYMKLDINRDASSTEWSNLMAIAQKAGVPV